MTGTIKLYYRLTKPGIIYGNMLSLIGAFLLAAGRHWRPGLLLATILGTALVIASGCVFNNYIDRNIDKKMARTKRRALVQGIIPSSHALTFASLLGAIGFIVLSVWTPAIVVLLGAIALFFYVIVYGYAKRHSIHGTLVGTIPGAASAVAGYSAVVGHLNMGGVLLFIIMACWQMAHFYAIALYRQSEYANAGVPVMPVVHGVRSTRLQIIGYVGLFIIANALLTIGNYAGFTYLFIATLLGTAWLYRCLQPMPVDQSALWGKRIFLFSLIVLLGISFLWALDPWLP